jgi:hypothetical protein
MGTLYMPGVWHGERVGHVVPAVERDEQPLLPSDAVDLGNVLGVPAQWLGDGWESSATPSL